MTRNVAKTRGSQDRGDSIRKKYKTWSSAEMQL
jgi:hypothetical protein